MADDITPPTRREPIINKDGTPTLRMANFMEIIADRIPNTIPDITDVSGLTVAGNQAKINEILTALRDSGIIV